MANPTDPINKGLSEVSKGKPLEPEEVIKEKPGADFASHMQKGSGAQTGGPVGAATGSSPTPLELARPANFQPAAPSFNSLLSQAKGAQDTLGTVAKQLQSPNLKLKRSQTHLLRNKLTDANAHINTAAAKLGIEPSQVKPSGGGHVEKFLSYINAGQNQFSAIQAKLQEMSASGEQLNAGDMMLLQAKMGVAQQEIEYSSTLLSKVIDSIKQIMAIQL